MSDDRQLPQRIIREYLDDLVVFKKAFTREDFANHFVSVFLEAVPPGDDVPEFKEAHRRDELKVAKAKIDANNKKFWRAIDGTTYLPLVFIRPIIDTLNIYGVQHGMELDRLLLRNDGWMAIPVPNGHSNHADVYSNMLKEFAEANSAVAVDLSDDGQLNNSQTSKETLDAIEAMISVYLASQSKVSNVVVELKDRLEKS